MARLRLHLPLPIDAATLPRGDPVKRRADDAEAAPPHPRTRTADDGG
jgi:hypothetical protein